MTTGPMAGAAVHDPHPAPLVGALIAGTQKGGTSALSTYFAEHPEIGMPRIKEVHYFDSDTVFAGGQPDAAAYEAQFPRRSGVRIFCDATPIYMFWAQAPERIHRYNPAMKWILLLRNPITRAYSQWNMNVKKGREPLSFEQALQAEAGRTAAVAPGQSRHASYVARGRYSEQITRIRRWFPAEQLLVLPSDALQYQPAPTLAAVASFLGVGPFPRAAPREVFRLPYEAPMPAGARAFLHAAFAPEFDRLEQMLGWDLRPWREPPPNVENR
ncbi:MAG: sulfotransferase [Proteobacteria bacterium]|nr:sulfotransferase [Pseudomonadota bacterium]